MRRRKRRRGASKPARAARHSWLQPLKARPPAPFFDSGERPVAAGPETALLCAVLEDALTCIYEAKDPELVAEAERWFFRDRSRGVFSFLSLCEALDLDADEIRSRLANGMKVRVAAALKQKPKNPSRRAAALPPKWLGGGAPRLTRK